MVEHQGADGDIETLVGEGKVTGISDGEFNAIHRWTFGQPQNLRASVSRQDMRPQIAPVGPLNYGHRNVGAARRHVNHPERITTTQVRRENVQTGDRQPDAAEPAINPPKIGKITREQRGIVT
jgi:hypothetical protein